MPEELSYIVTTSSALPTVWQWTGDFVQLFHGTGLQDAQNIKVCGYSASIANECAGRGQGSFWATTDPTDAKYFSLIGSAEPPRVVLEFQLPTMVITKLLLEGDAWLRNEDGRTYEFEFGRHCSETLNENMTEMNIRLVE